MIILILAAVAAAVSALLDPRDLSNGALMVQDNYLDQPYCVLWHNASIKERWVCAITRNNRTEGNLGEHVEVVTSDTNGAIWSAGIRLEAEDAPTNAYSTIIQNAAGRIYVIYNQNLPRAHSLPGNKSISRDDELGNFSMRWTEDGGDSWSSTRIVLPYRNTAIDRNNSWAGAVDIMWCVDQAKVALDGSVLWAFTKIGTYAQSPPEEMWMYSSPNLLTATAPEDVIFNMLPDGDVGVSLPVLSKAGTNLEEAHVIPLVSGGMFMVGRTSAGYLAASNTADSSGRSGWAVAYAATYWTALPAGAGRALKNPQGPITLKRMANGRYLLLYYFQGTPGYSTRDPYWLSSGVEEGGQVKFSQPEIVLYDFSLTTNRPGYPDFVQTSDGAISITETNKTHARVHRIQPSLLQALFTQDTVATLAAGNLALNFTADSQGKSFATPALPDPSTPTFQGDGFTVGLWLARHNQAVEGQVLIDVGTFSVVVGPAGSLHASVLSAALPVHSFGGNLTTDSECTARLLQAGASGTSAYAAVTLDAMAHVLSWSVNGAVCDGSTESLFGWGWISPSTGSLSPSSDSSFALGQPQAGKAGKAYAGAVAAGQWYSRALLNSELVGNWRAGP